MKKLAVFGSTGSIGRQTLEVCRNLGIEIDVLTAGENIDLLYEQIIEFKPRAVAVANEQKALALRERLRTEQIETRVFSGENGLIDIFALDFDFMLNALVGSMGLIPTLSAIDKGVGAIAIANKETLVAAGELVMKRAKKRGVRIIPVDSEHSAIFQCLAGNNPRAVEKLILTASGGPFRGYTAEELKNVKKSDALKHPNWNMGVKITIDSATLMNKGLEVIEARWLFGLSPENIEVVIHPQSVIHSMVQFQDGAIMAQLGCADMRVPIQYALTYPERPRNDFPRFDFFDKIFTFERPDNENFPCLSLSRAALDSGGLIPAVMNAANEIAVKKFLNEEISFADIPVIIESSMNKYIRVHANNVGDYSVEDVITAESIAKMYAQNIRHNRKD